MICTSDRQEPSRPGGQANTIRNQEPIARNSFSISCSVGQVQGADARSFGLLLLIYFVINTYVYKIENGSFSLAICMKD